MRIRFDHDRCAGHAQCAMTAPDVFPLDDAGYCELRPVTDVPAHLEEQARDGARRCPERALTIVVE